MSGQRHNHQTRCGPPIVIGGVGGSGTRVVAEILRTAGVFMGRDLNAACDNLLFTSLFKRPRWLPQALNVPGRLARGLAAHEALFLRHRRLSLGETLFTLRAALSMARFGQNAQGSGRGTAWLHERLQRLPAVDSGDWQRRAPAGRWGWKEPNTHLLVPALLDEYPDMHYVHVFRHGMDMAFSANQQQLHNWHRLLEVEPPAQNQPDPGASLRFWIAAHRRILEIADEKRGQAMHFVDFDGLCDQPGEHVRTLLGRLGLQVSDRLMEGLVAIPRKPSSTGRYREHPQEVFSKCDRWEFEQIYQRLRHRAAPVREGSGNGAAAQHAAPRS